jgi:fructose-1,6-bisphosphatase/sedoheptulose 1,7-bisphosphatase-like protein
MSPRPGEGGLPPDRNLALGLVWVTEIGRRRRWPLEGRADKNGADQVAVVDYRHHD